MRGGRVTPTAWDIEYAARQREIERNIAAWDAEQAVLSMAEYRRDRERWGRQPRRQVPPVAGYDAAARRLGCEDAYEDDLQSRYGEEF
jgi:hypothetical protein